MHFSVRLKFTQNDVHGRVDMKCFRDSEIEGDNNLQCKLNYRFKSKPLCLLTLNTKPVPHIVRKFCEQHLFSLMGLYNEQFEALVQQTFAKVLVH